MAFKMKGFPKQKGTKGFYYTPQSQQQPDYTQDEDYDANFEYDRLGRPINDPNAAANIGNQIQKKTSPGIDPGETTNVFGSLTTNVRNDKDKSDKYKNYTEEQHADMLEDAVKWFKSREKQFGVGNVDRSNMANSRFYDYLANYGGPESAGGSWLQQRMIDSAYGRVDNEPHIPKDKRMYEEGEWTADKSPSLRTIRKNIAEQYMNIMNNTSNPDFVGGYSDSSNLINKRDAMKLARTLAQTKSLTRYPDPIRDNQSTLTAEEEEIKAKKIDEQTEKDVEELDRTLPIVEEKPVEEEVVASGKRENPYEYGTDEYYDFKKQERSRKLGLTKRIFNIYDNK